MQQERKSSANIIETRQSSRRSVFTGVLQSMFALGAGRFTDGKQLSEARPVVISDRHTITLGGATALVAAAVAKAREIGVNVSVAVVDESGVLKAFARMDRAGPATVDIVPNKAYTAAAFRTPTQALAQRSQDQLTQAVSFANLPRVTLLPGGLPISVGGSVIGGLGVGGGTGDQDVEIAEAALAAVL